MIAKAESKPAVLRLWQFSDTHLFAAAATQLYDINSLATLRQVFALATSNDSKADLAIFTGDLVHDGSAEGYRRLLTEIEGLGVPAYCLSGNHDDPVVMRSILATDKVYCTTSVDMGDWLIILLDSTVPGHESGYLSESELARVDSLLNQYPNKHVLLALHHPPLPTTMTWLDQGVTLNNPERLHEIVGNYSSIRGVIWGHAHQASYQINEGFVWAGCPSTMAQFKPGVVKFTLDTVRPGFRYLDLYADGTIDTDVIRV